MRRRKPWRNYRKHYITKRQIRLFCLLILTAEALVLGRRGFPSIPTVEVRKDGKVIIRRTLWEEGPAPAEGGETRIYGIRIRLEDGVLEFYGREHEESPVKP